MSLLLKVGMFILWQVLPIVIALLALAYGYEFITGEPIGILSEEFCLLEDNCKSARELIEEGREVLEEIQQ